MRSVALFVIGLCLGCAPDAKHGGPTNAGAQEVLREMMNSYSTMPSYEQTGIVRTVAKGAAKTDAVHETRFHMGFARPDALELQYGDHVTLSARGRDVKDGDGGTYASVDEAIRSLSKATLGVSRLVPSMLLGRGNYPWPEELWSTVRWTRAEEVSGDLCDVLTVELSEGGEWALWVEQERHVLRKTSKTGHLDDGLVEATVTYEPVGDRPR